MLSPTYERMRMLLTLAMFDMGLADPSLYRLRHGGASHDVAIELRSLAEVKKRGRWVSDSSVRRYSKAIRLQQAENQLSQPLQEWVAAHEPNLASYLVGRGIPAPPPQA